MENRRSSIFSCGNLIFLGTVGILLYVLYIMLGGDYSRLVPQGDATNPVEAVLNSLAGLGKAIGNQFSRILK